MQLTYDQKKHIFDHGYVIIPGVVPRVMIDSALKVINHTLGKENANHAITHELPFYKEILGLLNDSPALGLAESVMGEGGIQTVDSSQVALRHPGLQDPPKPPSPHLDGMHTPTNGVPEGQIVNFTALVSVLLSDVQSEYAGNFTVWPGTHRIYESYFKEHGPERLIEGMPKVDLPSPHFVTGKAGDMVIAHYLLAHSASANISPHIRYACFYRLYHVDQDPKSLAPLTDMWKYWPGIREAFN
jgi:hypothetical protein